jgi:hypothetical protein
LIILNKLKKLLNERTKQCDKQTSSISHPGYGLPMGGVLSTENAVIPYGVGTDIISYSCLDISGKLYS